MRPSKWDKRFLDLAMTISTWSKDPHRKTGAVVITPDRRRLSIGYNGFPKGVTDDVCRLKDKETRLMLTVHAELNAIYNADFPLTGCTMYVANNFPCHLCAQGIVQVGISRVLADRAPQPRHPTWGKSWQQSVKMFSEAGVEWEVRYAV